MRLALIANPRSGGGLDPEALVEAMREHGAHVEVFDELELERVAPVAPDRIVVAGGDGSIAPAAWAAGRLDVPLAVVPGGTANDFARTNGLPEDPLDAAVLAVTGRTVHRLELGYLADGHPFVNVANVGLASSAARYASPFKRLLGPLAYGVGALRAAATDTPLRCSLRVDGREAFAGGAWQLIVAVTGAFGGGSELGAADPRDGVLDVAVLPAGSRLALARRAWGLRRGTIAEQRRVQHHRARVVEVQLPAGTELNVDGELRRGGLERVTVEPGAYALVIPGP